MNPRLLSMLFFGIWALEPKFAHSQLPFVASLIKGEQPVYENYNTENTQMYAATNTTDGVKQTKVADFATSGDSDEQVVAVIPMKEVIIKYDQWCGPSGTETMAKRIREANRNPNVAGILIDSDTPGGHGDAVQNPSAAIKECSKPVITWSGNGMTASAGYYIASSSTEIYATYETDEIGSIGTYVTLADWYGYFEKEGLKVEDIYASASTEKNIAFREAMKGNREPLIKEWLDPFNEVFMNTVKSNRPDINEKALHGKLYTANDALAYKLIDGFKTFDEAVARVFELAEQGPDGAGKNNNTANFKIKIS